MLEHSSEKHVLVHTDFETTCVLFQVKQAVPCQPFLQVKSGMIAADRVCPLDATVERFYRYEVDKRICSFPSPFIRDNVSRRKYLRVKRIKLLFLVFLVVKFLDY